MTTSHGQFPGQHGSNQHGGNQQRALPAELSAILAEVAPAGAAFRHRQHIHLAFIAVQRYGASRAPGVVTRWIRHIAAYERAPQKFNATVTRAWTEIVAHHVTAGPPAADFASFAEHNAVLLDKRLLNRHYSSQLLASTAARSGWAEPDLAGFPWAS
jgi:hypothetical protein